MFKILRMKSLPNRSPVILNSSSVASFSNYFRFKHSILLRNTNSIKPLKNPNFVPVLSVVNSLAKPPKPSSSSHGQGFFAEFRLSGEIHVILGPMFAGKTTTLLQRMKSESINVRSVALIKSNKDTCYALDSIVTHDGERLPCVPLKHLSSIREKLGAEAYDKAYCSC